MNIVQGQIVEVPFNLPEGTKPHPLIVLSSNDAIEQEEAFFGIMLTSEESYNDEFTFEIKNEHLLKPLKVKYCQARLHLVSFFNKSDVITNSNWNNHVKKEYFEFLVETIIATHFSFIFD